MLVRTIMVAKNFEPFRRVFQTDEFPFEPLFSLDKFFGVSEVDNAHSNRVCIKITAESDRHEEIKLQQTVAVWL